MIFKIKSLFSNSNNKTLSYKIFDRIKHIQNRQYASKQNIENIFLKQSVDTLADNLSSITKKYDGEVVYFGQGIAQFLNNTPNNFTPKKLFFCDINEELIETSLRQIRENAKLNNQFQIQYYDDKFQQNDKTSIIPICCDEEFWPFQENQLQLIISNMSLHWVNDLQVVFIKWLDSLEADGTLIGSMFGEDTLQELRISYTLAENERYGGVSPHVSPLITITEVGNLLTRLKYTLPTICTERNLYQFDSVYHLMQYIQDIGEGEALYQKRQGTFKQTIQSMSAIYETLFKNENMKVSATFEQIYFSAWKYHEKQQQPKSRGAKKVSLHDIQKEITEMDPNETIVYGTVTEDSYSENIIQGKGQKKK